MAEYDASKLMDEMDPDLLEFLQTKVNSFIKWDLVRFFHNNPHTTDTADNIARYAGRDARTIEAELAQLAKADILVREQLGELFVYTLTADAQMRDLIARFVAACNEREFRVKAIYHVIRGMKD
ncbi:MAG: hypothetical protein JXB47_15185 [Anaerolineae bacterium]|nr:hypothetical protein [Anaerolineae bacterium]